MQSMRPGSMARSAPSVAGTARAVARSLGAAAAATTTAARAAPLRTFASTAATRAPAAKAVSAAASIPCAFAKVGAPSRALRARASAAGDAGADSMWVYRETPEAARVAVADHAYQSARGTLRGHLLRGSWALLPRAEKLRVGLAVFRGLRECFATRIAAGSADVAAFVAANAPAIRRAARNPWPLLLGGFMKGLRATPSTSTSTSSARFEADKYDPVAEAQKAQAVLDKFNKNNSSANKGGEGSSSGSEKPAAEDKDKKDDTKGEAAAKDPLAEPKAPAPAGAAPTAKPDAAAAKHETPAAGAGAGADAAGAGGVAGAGAGKKKKLSDRDWESVLDEVGASYEKKAAASKGSGKGGKGGDKGEDGKADEDDDEDEKDKGLPTWAKYVGGGVLAATVLGYAYKAMLYFTLQSHSWQEFKTAYLDQGLVERLVVHEGAHVQAILKRSESQPHREYAFNAASNEVLEVAMEVAREAAGVAPDAWVPISYVSDASMDGLGSLLLSAATLYLMFRIFSGVPGMLKGRGGGGLGGMGPLSGIAKAPFTRILAKDAKVRFKDVAGVDEAKREIQEFVDFLRNPARYHKLGAKIPKGGLLVGPPGTGKTLLAKATAGEAGVPFFSISGSDFTDMYVGIGSARVRDLFKHARKAAPSIIFIDEIDAIGRQRGGRGGGNEERDNTLIQMLVEMDGFKTTENVIVLAGTNRVDILDKALLRPGRFDRRITVDAPDIAGRVEIYKVHLAKIKLNHDINDLAARLAALTPGMVGADIANVCNEGALMAARGDKAVVELVDFEKAIDRVIGGLERPGHVMNAKERELVAYHEAGHAVAGWMLEHAEPLLKVTIVPRTSGALGFAQYLPSELALKQTEQLADNIAMTLGGRASEQIFYGKISTGASNDLEQAHRTAGAMVNVFGMTDRLPNFSYPKDKDQFYKPVSEATSEAIDAEVAGIIKAQYARVLALLTQHKDKVDALARALLERETINHDGLVALLGPRPFASDAYVKFMQMQKQTLATIEQHPQKVAPGSPEDATPKHGVKGEPGNTPAATLAATIVAEATTAPPSPVVATPDADASTKPAASAADAAEGKDTPKA